MQTKIQLKTAAGLVGVLVLLLVGLVDYASGYRLNFSVFYYLPVALWAWELGLLPGVAMACAGAAVWGLSDLHASYPFVSGTYLLLNTLGHLTAFMVVAAGVCLFHERFLREEHLNAALQKAFKELGRSMEEVRTLKEQALVICPVTHRIRVGGEWIHLKQFFREKFELSVKEAPSEDAMSDMADRMMEYHDTRDAAA